MLEGRIRIGQGNVPAARALFHGVLQSQPNNVEARLGTAEADIADGKPQTALGQYVQTLKLAPESTRAILSLAMLSDESGDTAKAGSYYELALKSHSSDPQVQLAAAAWYASTGNFPIGGKARPDRPVPETGARPRKDPAGRHLPSDRSVRGCNLGASRRGHGQP